MNKAQALLLALGVQPFLLMRFGGKRASATKRGPGRVYAWGKGHRIEGDVPPGTQRLRQGHEAKDHDSTITAQLWAGV